MPAGCFWADRDAVQEILDAEDSFSLAGVNGFAARDLDNGNWFEPAPAANSQKMQVFAKSPQPARIIANVYSLAP
jgi:hypothetical protein